MSIEQMRNKYKEYLKKHPQNKFTQGYYNFFAMFSRDYDLLPPTNAINGVNMDAQIFGETDYNDLEPVSGDDLSGGDDDDLDMSGSGGGTPPPAGTGTPPPAGPAGPVTGAPTGPVTGATTVAATVPVTGAPAGPATGSATVPPTGSADPDDDDDMKADPDFTYSNDSRTPASRNKDYILHLKKCCKALI